MTTEFVWDAENAAATSTVRNTVIHRNISLRIFILFVYFVYLTNVLVKMLIYDTMI